jgi:predicted dehydrogenase
MAFANIYRDFFSAVLLKLLGEDPTATLQALPTAQDGLSTMRLIDAAVRSNDQQSPMTLNTQPLTASLEN